MKDDGLINLTLEDIQKMEYRELLRLCATLEYVETWRYYDELYTEDKVSSLRFLMSEELFSRREKGI